LQSYVPQGDGTWDYRNELSIHGANTFVSGSVISESQRRIGLAIFGGAEIQGLVYHGGDDVGRTFLNNCRIDGTFMSTRFCGASPFCGSTGMDNLWLIHADDFVRDALTNTPLGVRGFRNVMAEPNSWEDPYNPFLTELP